jgi:hypothetical protein
VQTTRQAEPFVLSGGAKLANDPIPAGYGDIASARLTKRPLQYPLTRRLNGTWLVLFNGSNSGSNPGPESPRDWRH